MRIPLLAAVALLPCACDPRATAAPAPEPEGEPEAAAPGEGAPPGEGDPPGEGAVAEISKGESGESDPPGVRSPTPVELRKAASSLPIRTKPSTSAPLRGYTGEGASFRVLSRLQGEGPCKSGWGELEAKGFLCLDGTEPTDEPPAPWPQLVRFDPPDPVEFEKYKESGVYDHGQPEALVPAVYAKRWGRFKGRLYSSLEAFERGESSSGQLEPGVGMKYRFERIVETEKGPVLLRDDGKVARLDDVYLYPITRHQGFDLQQNPIPAGQLPAFSVAYEGAPVVREPREDAETVKTLPYHAPVLIEEKPADSSGHWWRLADGSGYVNDWRSIRRPVPSPGRPKGVADDEIWVDVELEQQVLTIYRGDAMVYFTVVATGAAPMGTPKGTYQILGMYAFKNMQSREGAEDVYFVEDVPWTMVFKPAYALHAAYWHWGFGRTASHGCVNLAPRDAAWIFSHLEPRLPDGWRVILTPSERPPEMKATVVRIRRGDDAGEDKRQ